MSDKAEWEKRGTCHGRGRDGRCKIWIFDESGFIFIGGGSGRGCLFWILLSVGLSVLLTVGVNLLLLLF